MSQRRAIIIGAGYGGMALANLLAKAGFVVDVYEKNDQLGGRITTLRQDGFTFELGPSWYLMPEVFESYYSLFGKHADEELDLARLAPGYTVYYDSHAPLTIQGDVEVDKVTFDTLVPGAGVTLERYVARSSLAYEVATKYFLYSNFQNPGAFLKWDIIAHTPALLSLVWRPLDRYVSRYFHEQHLKQILEYHMVFLGSSPFQAPAIYTLMSHLDFKSGVFYPRRGMYRLAESMRSLGEPMGVKYHLSSPVRRIIVENGKAVGVELHNGDEVRADVVISNADLHFTETQLLEQPHQTYPEQYWRARQPGPGALLIALGIKGQLPQLTHHTLYFVDKWRENFEAIYETHQIPEAASIYVCNATKTDPSLAPPGHENVFILVPIPAAVELSDVQTDTLASRTVAQLARMSDTPDLAQRIVTQVTFGPREFGERYNAWEYNAFGGESHLLRQSVIFRTRNYSRKVENLYYVGAGALPGIGLPMCIIGAEQTYKRIMGIRRDGPLATLEDIW